MRLEQHEDLGAESLYTRYIDEVRSLSQGGRGNGLWAHALQIGHLVGAGRIDQGRAETDMLDGALRIGLDRGNALDTITRGIAEGAKQPLLARAQNQPAEYIYTDAEGQPLYRKLRSYDNGKKKFTQQRFANGEWEFGLGETPRVLYRLPQIAAAREAGQTIYLVEGEKDVETLEARGQVATTVPEGAGHWNASFTEALAGANVRIIADYDTAGLKFAARAWDELQAAGSQVETFLPRDVGWDISDHLDYGCRFSDLKRCTREDLDVELAALSARQTDGIISHAELMLMDFPEQQWVVDDLIAPGVTLLFSVPKGRKSFLCLDLAISVSTGRPMLGKYPVKQGSVLYLALEDSALRLRGRSEKILDGAVPGPLFVYPIDSGPWGNLDEEGADRIVNWCRSVKDARLIIIDVFEKVRGRRKGDSVYGTDYEAIRPLGEIAKETGCAVVVVHHTSKRDYNPEDPMISASGSNGLRGSVDNLIFLRKKGDEGSLVIEGRDLNPAEVPLVWDQTNLRWLLSDKPLDEDDLIELTNMIGKHGPINRSVAISTLGGDKFEAEGTLRRLLSRGQLVEDRRSGEITLPGALPDPESGTKDSSLW